MASTTGGSSSTANKRAVLGVDLPPGRFLELPGRGVTFLRDQPGPVGAPVVMLLHGWTATADLNFFRVFPRLTGAYRVLAMDLRGHGRGIRPRAYFRLEDCADDVIAVADQLGIDRVVPVGYSMGGTVAQLVAHRHPTRTAGLVLCSTAASFRAPDGTDRFMWNGLVPAMTAALSLTPPALRQQLLSRFVLARNDGTVPGWMLDEMRRNDPAAVAQAGLALSRFDSTPWIGELGRTGSSAIPAAVVVTTEDGTVPPSRQRALAAGLSGANVFEVVADHRAAITSADAWVPQLRKALAAVLR